MPRPTPTIPAPRAKPQIRARRQLALGLGPDPADVGRARRQVGEWLGGAAECVSLVLSELAGNALRHAAGAPAELTVTVGADGVLVEVRDGSARAPALSGEADPYAETGRGLTLVAALSADWGWAPQPDGTKTTWALLPHA